MVLIIKFYAFPRSFVFREDSIQSRFKETWKMSLLFNIIVEKDPTASLAACPNVLKPLKGNL